MAQNKYDEPEFFANYSQLPRSVHGLDGAAEWPTVQTLLPPMARAHVLDLGCGFGWFCRWARTAGAARVHGIDVSQNMLDRAARDTADDAVTYQRADLDEVLLPSGEYDLVYSSLTLHYLVDVARLFAEVARTLRPGGSFVATLEHPIFTAPSAPGFVQLDGREVWPLDGYSREGSRVTDWLAPGVVKQHRTLTSYLGALRRAGFTLTDFVEWSPSEDELREHPDWVTDLDRPMFLMFGARRQ